MAVMVSIAAGSDAGYYFKQAGAGKQAGTGAAYYLVPGERPGYWASAALEQFGMADGAQVDQEQFMQLYGEFVAPDGTRLGAPLRSNPALEARYQAKLADAGQALTFADKRALWYEARAEAVADGARRMPVMYWDTTFSVDKTISLAHATALAKALEAREAGDLAGERYWTGQADTITTACDAAARVFIDTMQAGCRTVRTGHHGQRIDGVEQGRFEDSSELAVAVFPQSTSRDGDPQLHWHCVWLNRVQAARDGVWRAVDSRSMHQLRGAASAKAALVLETILSRDAGFEWQYREASKGRVIAGVPDRVIRAFSARRESIDKRTAQLIADYRAQNNGAEPSRYHLHALKQFATLDGRAGKDDAPVDTRKLLADWERKAVARELGRLADLAGTLWSSARGAAQAQAMTEAQARQTCAVALAEVQDGSATFGRAALVAALGRNLPDGYQPGDVAEAGRVLDDLADRIIGSEDLVRLDVAEFPRAPDSLRRADGSSLYQAPNRARYATRDQLDAEQALLRRAGAPGAPHLDAQECAELLGADRAELEAQLTGAAREGTTGAGLRLDQAAAAYAVLTSDRRSDVIIAAAGSGKTYTAAAMAKAWRGAGMGRVIGLTLTSAGRNELRDAGVPEALNFAEFLGHSKTEREEYGATDPGPAALLLVDEASMAGLHDLAAVYRIAASAGAKVVTLGDHAQLESPSAGGGLGLLARELGYAHLQEPVRFAPGWERDASLALRAGDVACLQAYDEHGRLHGGDREGMLEDAARRYVADHLAGLDVCLSAYSHTDVDELSRRAQDYVRRAGVTSGPEAQLREGRTAQAGDLVRARVNNRGVRDADGRHIANGDVLRVVSVGEDQVQVRRSAGHDRETGQRLWSDPYAVPAAYLAESAELGYASTIHTIEGYTAWRGATVVPSTATRNAVYPGATRGRDRNDIYAYQAGPDHAPGEEPGSDPELDRAGRLADELATGVVAEPGSPVDPVALLAPVVARDGIELSATETMRAEALNADHMARLWSIRQDVTRLASAERFAAAVRAQLTAAQTEAVLADTDDLFRALRAAEITGMDAGQALASAIAARPLDDASSVPAVLAHRVRQVAEPRPPTARRDLVTDDPELAVFAAELDDAMTERESRIGAHAAATAPLWATRNLGPVPEDAEAQAAWTASAGKLGGWRELSGTTGDGLGPKPGTTHPERRAEWQRAADATPLIDGMDLRGLSDGQLLTRRQAFARETAWAPPNAGRELGVACRAADGYQLMAARHDQLAAEDPEGAQLHQATAAALRSAAERATNVASILAGVQQAGQDWEALTADTLRVAKAADTEARRRGLLEDADKLASAEAQAFTYASDGAEPAEAEVRDALGISEQQLAGPVPERVQHLALTAERAQGRIDELRTLAEPEHQGEDELAPSEAWGTLIARQREAIIQHPEPPMPPSARARQAQREHQLEAG